MAQRSSGFDMSRMSTASKILLGASILLIVDSFLTWQDSVNMWSGDGSFFGFLAGLLTILLLVWEAIAVANIDVNISAPRSKISAYLGFGVLAFVILKFVFALTESPAYGAFIGLILGLAIGYGAWMRFQEPESAAMPPPSSNDMPGMPG